MTPKTFSALLLVLAALACEQESGTLSPAPPKDAWPELLAVPHPDLETAETAARQALEQARVDLQRLRSDRETPPGELAQAFGRMGDLYQAYDLREAAGACYGNARALEAEEFRWPYAEGLLHEKGGRLPEALTSFTEATRIRPEDPAARLRRGETWLSLGEPGKALKDFEIARAAGGAFEAAAHFGIGRSQASLGQLREAVASFRRVQEVEPAAGAVRYPLAQVLQKLGDRDGAREVLAGSGAGAVGFPDPLFEDIRDLAASSAALTARGGEALVEGDLEKAEELYRRAVQADPANLEARRNLAVALTRGGRESEAAKALEAALRLEPDNALVAFDLANARLAAGEFDGALDAFRRSLESQPDLEAAHFNLANALMQGQRWQEAETHLRRCLEISPENTQASYLLAMARYQQGEQKEGLQGLRNVLRRDPSMTAARMSLASILTQTGRLDQARRQYAAVVDRERAAPAEKAAAYTQLAALSLRQRREAEGESQLRQALAVLPGDEAASAALTELLTRQGRASEAAQVFEQWATSRPQSPAAQLGWGEALISQGNYRLARETLEKAAEIFPGNASLTHALARLLATAPEAEIRDGARARRLAEEAYVAQRSLDHAETLAMAMAETGDFAEAVRWQSGLLDQAKGMGNQQLVQRISRNLALYEAGTPVRIPRGGAGGA